MKSDVGVLMLLGILILRCPRGPLLSSRTEIDRIATPNGASIVACKTLVHASIGYAVVSAAWDVYQADEATWLSHDGLNLHGRWSTHQPALFFGWGIAAYGLAGVIGIGPDQADPDHAVAVWQLR